MFCFANVNVYFQDIIPFSVFLFNADLCLESLSRGMEHGIGSFNWPNVRRNVNTLPSCVWTKVCGHKKSSKNRSPRADSK